MVLRLHGGDDPFHKQAEHQGGQSRKQYPGEGKDGKPPTTSTSVSIHQTEY